MNDAERAFKNWLENHNIPYFYIEQSPETFSGVFRSIAKRPDFLVVIRHLGIIAVDVKSQTINPNIGHKNFVLDEENEVKKYIEFEKITRLPVWIVFGKPEENYNAWYWIPLFKILEFPLKTSSRNKKPFRTISTVDCIHINVKQNEPISKLILGLIK